MRKINYTEELFITISYIAFYKFEDGAKITTTQLRLQKLRKNNEASGFC